MEQPKTLAFLAFLGLAARIGLGLLGRFMKNSIYG